MYIAVDGNGKRISIENVDSRTKYFCPSCLQELDLRRGQIRQHHFAHKKNSSNCTDTWIRKGNYDDVNTWHHDWQLLFPEENQEITLAFGNIKHRGDVVINDTVIEFQHSNLSHNKFDERTNFYHSCDCKVIWVFDLIEDYNSNVIYEETDNVLFWNNPKRTFDYFDTVTGDIELFFQLKENKEEKCLVRISKIKGRKNNKYEIGGWYDKQEFFDYLGYKNNTFPLPNLVKIDLDSDYISFKEKYSISLNEQQERVLQHIDGATMMLAVPGSGKTTTLISRLGYMINSKNINPEEVLAITYTTKAAKEMSDRYIKLFGDNEKKINFRTINSICDEIVKKVNGNRRIITNDNQRRILGNLYKTANYEYATETDFINMQTEISFVKNMLIDENDIEKYKWNTNEFSKIYKDYNVALNKENYIDFDDQLIIAYDILRNNKNNLLDFYRKKFHYVCVDEAQDTSKVQHKIIELLVKESNNIFMVGDEDQSIYGYRGAYPQALFEFKNVYKNPYIRKLETNYRSNSEIVEVANVFIDRNPNRISKKMTSNIGQGGNAYCIETQNRYQQFYYLLDIAKNGINDSTAILYRNNDSAIPLIDLFERNEISYSLNRANNTFFSNRVLADITNMLKFSLDLENQILFMQIYYKFNMYFNRRMAEYACSYSRSKHIPLLDEFINQSRFGKRYYEDRAEYFVQTFRNLSKLKPIDAIDELIDLGYVDYAEEKNYGIEKLDLIRMIANNEDSVEAFLNRLEYLENKVKEKISDSNNSNSKIVLSTIHSCKGMEFDSVYIIDAIDGILPSRKSISLRVEEKFGEYEEERRLMYVAITRAKHNLYIFRIEDETSEFVRELTSDYSSDDCIFKTKRKNKIENIEVVEPLANEKPAIVDEETSIEDKLKSLFGDKFSVKNEVPEKDNSIKEPEVNIKEDEDLYTILDLWEMYHPKKVLVVRNNLGQMFRITSNPRSMIEKYHGNCYGEPYGPGVQPNSISIPDHELKIWKYETSL